MKTRTKKPASTAKSSKDTETPTVQTLQPNVSNPPHVFILPKQTSSEARIVTLPNPATSTPSRYFICPEKGWYEFTRVAAPKKACRSWLLAPDRFSSTNGSDIATDGKRAKGKGENEGYVLQNPDLMIATPIDPLFLLLPALMQDVDEASDGKQMFLPLAHYLDILEERSEHFKNMNIKRYDAQIKLEETFEERMHVACDVVEAGDETLYRLSLKKMTEVLVVKAKKMVEHGLPASMEERFVKRELAVPVLSVRREESSMSVPSAEESTAAGAESEAASQATSQDTQVSTTSMDSASTAATSISSTTSEDLSTPNDQIMRLLRLRTALKFILTSYIPPNLRSSLGSYLAKSQSIDFSPLDQHLNRISELKKEAQALRSMSNNISRKRSAMEDDEALEKAEAKKRKKEEEEFRKKNSSRGVQQLKKADTSGMKKLSSFFTKGAVKKN